MSYLRKNFFDAQHIVDWYKQFGLYGYLDLMCITFLLLVKGWVRHAKLMSYELMVSVWPKSTKFLYKTDKEGTNRVSLKVLLKTEHLLNHFVISNALDLLQLQFFYDLLGF